MKLSEWKLHIEDLIEKYGDVDIEHCNRDHVKVKGFAIGKEYMISEPDGVDWYEYNGFDDELDKLLNEWHRDNIVEVKYLFKIDYEDRQFT